VIHLVLPDAQITPWSNTAFVGWIGRYIVDHFSGKDLTIINLGDWFDMPSLSSYDRGKRVFEGRRYVDDIQAGSRALDVLMAPLLEHQAEQRQRKVKQWNPRRVYILGNHEERILRATNDEAMLDGALSLSHVTEPFVRQGWEVYDFLEVIDIDGIKYAHYFTNPANGRPLSGMIETRLKNIGCSFVQGHQQGLKSGMLETVSGRRRGIVAGSCYLDEQSYRGPQGREEWRGVLVLHEVANGDFDLMEVSLSYLCRRYEGISLSEFISRS
jgi:hypothetical protein